MNKYDPTGQKAPGPTAADVPIESLPTVELTEDQFKHAQEIAQSRSRSYDEIDGGRICGDQSGMEAHLTGVVGELAYAIRTGNSIDDTVYRYGDGGADFRNNNNIRIDVKTTATHLERPSLIVPTKPDPNADLYFSLHRIDTRTVRFIGFATRATVADHNPVRKPGDSLNYVIPQNELWLPPNLNEDRPDDSSNLSPIP